MDNSPAPRALVFDLDSVLISRGLSLANFAERFAAHYADMLGGVTARGVAYGLSEVDGAGFRTHAELASELRDLFPWRERPTVEELTAYWDAVLPQCVAADPEALQTLRWLREHGYLLGVMATQTPETPRDKITALGLDGFFALTLPAGDVGLESVDARVYALAAEALEVAPKLIWMVSGHPEDCLAAREAGLGAIFLQRAFYWPRGFEPPTHEITTLAELISLLDHDGS